TRSPFWPSIGLPPVVIARLRAECNALTSGVSRVTVRFDAVADAVDDITADADAAPRRRVAKVTTDGGCTPAWRGLDPARNAGDDGAVPVACAGDPDGARRSHAAPRRSHRDHEGRRDRRALPQGAHSRVPGGDARLPGAPATPRPQPREPSPVDPET